MLSTAEARIEIGQCCHFVAIAEAIQEFYHSHDAAGFNSDYVPKETTEVLACNGQAQVGEGGGGEDDDGVQAIDLLA